MSDFLLELGKNPQARKLIQSLGLPIPMPQALERAKTPWEERPLAERNILVGGKGALTAIIAKTLASAGAQPILFGDVDKKPFEDAGEAWGRPPKIGEDPEKVSDAWGIVFDATGIDSPESLRQLYDFARLESETFGTRACPGACSRGKSRLGRGADCD
jgi:3-oxoacyl-[acyl-carrier protein] reductase